MNNPLPRHTSGLEKDVSRLNSACDLALLSGRAYLREHARKHTLLESGPKNDYVIFLVLTGFQDRQK